MCMCVYFCVCVCGECVCSCGGGLMAALPEDDDILFSLGCVPSRSAGVHVFEKRHIPKSYVNTAYMSIFGSWLG